MRCPRCGAQVRAGQSLCPRCGRRVASTLASHLYRDRRRRLRRRRALRLAAIVLAAIILLALLASLIARRPAPSPAPTPPPTEAPQETSAPIETGAPSPTEPPSTVAPVETAEAIPATEAPTATGAPSAGRAANAPPTADIAARDDLIGLYWWMIDSGSDDVRLDSITLDAATIEEVTDKFSNYFNAYRVHADPPGVTVEFKAGLSALLAIEAGDPDALDADARFVAQQAQAAVSSLIRADMSDVEKELTIHDYILSRCEYQYDADDADRDSALGFFRNGMCRCSGYTDAFRLLGRLAGLEIEEIGGPTTRDAPGEKGHAWNLIRLDGLWYVVDLTWDDMVSPGEVEHVYFNLPAAAFGDTRSWDERLCPEGEFAASLDGNYFYYRPEYAAATADDAAGIVARQLDAGGSARLLVPKESVARDAAVELQRRYGAGSCMKLSQDITLNLYRFDR